MVLFYIEENYQAAIIFNNLQSLAKYLRQTLVFMGNSTLHEKLNIIFEGVFC